MIEIGPELATTIKSSIYYMSWAFAMGRILGGTIVKILNKQ